MPAVPILPSLPDGALDLVIRQMTQRILALENIKPPTLPNSATLIRQVQLALQVGGPNALNLTGLIGSFTGAGSGIIIGLHTVRLNSYAAAQQDLGTMFFETDRSALYVVALNGTLKLWLLIINRPFFAAAPPTGFTVADLGFIYGRTAFDRTWTWSGAAWFDTQGMPAREMVAYFNKATVPTGWALCVSGAALVSMADGSQRTVASIVDAKEQVEVLCLNESTGEMTTSLVIGWSQQPAVKSDWIRLGIRKGNGDGARSLDVTKDHRIMTGSKAWVPAADLRPGDTVMRYERTLTADGQSAILGMWLGDGTCDSRGVFGWVHCPKQGDYLKETAVKLGFPFYTTGPRTSTLKSGHTIRSTGHLRMRSALSTLAPNLASMMAGKRRKATPEVLDKLGAIGLAFWYMDDGKLEWDARNPEYARAQFHTEGFDTVELGYISRFFTRMFGQSPQFHKRNNCLGASTRLTGVASERFFALVAEYIHPTMRYKLPLFHRAAPYRMPAIEFYENALVPFRIETKRFSSLHRSKTDRAVFKRKYDLSVQGHHSFVANGFLVHNCDGSAVTISTATAGTTAGYVTPNLITNNPVLRGAAAAGGTNTINGVNGADFTINEMELVPMIRL